MENAAFNKQDMIARLAKFVRVITAPPFMIAMLLMVLSASPNPFADRMDICVAWAGLVILPLLAYPVHSIVPSLVPSLHSEGREGQRRLAFRFSLLGYALCFLYGLFRGSRNIRIIFCTYFFTVAVLLLVNKFLHIRASGHTASSISPCVFAFRFADLLSGIVFAFFFLLSVWASLYLKRHKPVDVFAGLLCFALAYIFTSVLFRML